MSEAEAAFREAMAAEGIVTHDPIIADGRIHRVHLEGTRHGWYVLHADGIPTGKYGSESNQLPAIKRDKTHASNLHHFGLRRSLSVPDHGHTADSTDSAREGKDSDPTRGGLLGTQAGGPV